MRRIGIVQTNPLHALDVSHPFYQFCDMLLAIDVHPVVGQFLGNDIKLLDTVAYQMAHFVENFLHRSTLVLSSYQRDSAISTMTITALADLNIGIVARCGNMTISFTSLKPFAFKVFQKLFVIELAIPAIHLRYFLFQLCQIAFRQTAHHKEFFDASFSLRLSKFQNGVNAFLFGIINKTTCINNDDFTLWIITIMSTMIAVSLHQTHQDLTVHEVLRASERNEIDGFLHANKESTNWVLLKSCKSSMPSPSPIYLTGTFN